jgi:hypothetical protein
MWSFWWTTIPRWALAAFFALGSWFNTFDANSIAEYRKWGYPEWFHFVTAAMELATAALLITAMTRACGAGLGCIVMIGAVATLLIHRQYTHAVLPAVIFALLVAVGWATLRV